MALTPEDVQQVLNAIKADSQGIESLPVASSLNNIKSLPAIRGNEVVSVPVSLLAEVAQAAATEADKAKDAANTAASDANAAKAGADNAAESASSAAEAARTAAELATTAAQGSIRKVTLQDKDGNATAQLTPDIHGNINLPEGGVGSGSGFYNITQLHPLASGFYTKETAIAVLSTAGIDEQSKPAMIITFEVSAGSWIDYRFESTAISNFAEPSAWKRYGGGDAIKKVTINSGTSSESYEADENGSITIPIEKTVVDPTLDENSTNPVQNKALTAALRELSGKYGAALQLNEIGEGADKAYSLSLLDENGNVLSTSDMFTGGGGGSVATTKIQLTRITANPTVKLGDDVRLAFNYDHIDTATGESTGNTGHYEATITHGATSSNEQGFVAAGSSNTLNVSKYMGVGTNTVRVKVTVGEGEQMQVSQISWTVTVVQLTLTSSFNYATSINQGDTVTIPYALSGSGIKTLRCYLDGVDFEQRAVTTSTANGSLNIPTAELAHGSHSVQLVCELELASGSVIKSNSIYFDIAVRRSANLTPIIAARFDYLDGAIIAGGKTPYIPVKQYDKFTLNYAAYNPRETPTEIKVMEGVQVISSAKVPFVATGLSLRAMSFGEQSCRIVCGDTTYHYKMQVSKSELNLTEPTDSLRLKLSAQGRTNSDTNRNEWSFNGIRTAFDGFKWGGDGWIDGALRLSDSARATVRYQPLAQPGQNADNSFSFIVKFRVSEVTNEAAEVISCVDSEGTGFVITTGEARMATKGKSSLVMKMAADQTYEVGFVSYPRAVAGSSDHEKLNTEMVYLYINGIMSGCVQRGASDNIYQTTPQYISLGATGATTDVYLMRCYGSYLSDSQILDCYIIDQESSDAMFDLYNRNNIIDGNGNISVDNVPDDMRYVIITGKEANGVATLLQAAVTNNKSTKFNVDEIMCIKRSEPVLNFRLVGGSISLQGTSSLAYPIKNYRIYLRNANKVDGQLYLGCDSQGVGGELQSKAKYSFKLAQNGKRPAPVNCFCLKADYAESSSSHNTGMARLVNDTLIAVDELTPAQRCVSSGFENDVRTTVDGEPCLLFYRETLDSTPVLIGKYNFNNDKSTESVFGFLDIPGYHDQAWIDEVFAGNNPTECWEFLNNDYPMGSFLDADFDARNDKGTPRWMDVFEARFPDDDGRNAAFEEGTQKPTYLEAIVKWVKSTQTNAPKFKAELSGYFDINYLCDYYMFTEIFGCVDQRIKNMMMAIWYNPDAPAHEAMGRMRAYMIFYDCDTILGVRNDGRLKYPWDINEDSTDPELSTDAKTVYAYAGHDSVLWKNLRTEFTAELAAAYRRIRAKMSNDTIFNMFDKEQSAKFCERIYNLDAQYKYVRPKSIGVDVVVDGITTQTKYSYLEAMQGSRSAHRRWWVTNRMHLFDARYSTGQYTATDITWKGNSAVGATVKATPARDFYFELRREGDTMVHSAVIKNQQWSYTYGQTANIGTIFHLLGGVFMKSLDLSGWGGFTDLNIPTLPILEELILGRVGSSYTLTELVIGTKLPMLKTLDIRNYTRLASLDLSGCSRIEEVNAVGCSVLSTISFAEGSPLRKLHLPSAYQTLVLRSMSGLTKDNIVFENKGNIRGLWIENCAQIDSLAMFREFFALGGLKYVRLTGIALSGTGTDLRAWYDAGLGGIDTYGNMVSKCKISGTYRLTSMIDDALHAALSTHFDELQIIQPTYTVLEIDAAVADPANYTNRDNNTGYLIGTQYLPSGHVARILAQRHRCLGKRTANGTVSICRLHDDNSNYYADATDIGRATPSVLTGEQGDVWVYEPNFWYKGVNDLASDKYYAFYGSYADAPTTAEHVKLFKGDISVITGFAVRANNPVSVVDDALVVNAAYSYCTVPIAKGYKQVRFPSVASAVYGGLFADDQGNVLGRVSAASSAGVMDGMYLFGTVPTDATQLVFTIKSSADFDYVLLTTSPEIEAIEPDWVHHAEYLGAAFKGRVVNDMLRSISQGFASSSTQTEQINYAANRGLSFGLVDWEMHKDVANLFYAKYGTRNSQGVCGVGAGASMGATAIAGMQDTFADPSNPTAAYAYIYINGEMTNLVACSVMGYENWHTGPEWTQGAILNAGVQDSKISSIMRDGIIRKIQCYASNWSVVFPSRIANGRYLDNVAVSINGSTSSYYCDTHLITGAISIPLLRCSEGASQSSGVANFSGQYLPDKASMPSRLCFRGKIIKVGSVSQYKSLTSLD